MEARHLAPNLRAHGAPPFEVAVIHGGPGAAGAMAPVARRLGAQLGVLEPLQTARTVRGQADELADALRQHASGPVTLIGHSWGAWLSVITAAYHPDVVGKLVLVSSGVFDDAYVPQMHRRRLERLTPQEREEFEHTIARLHRGAGDEHDALLERLGALSDKADTYEAIEPDHREEALDLTGQGAIYTSVWPEAAALRASGALLDIASQVRVPVVVIHGDSDPTPVEGVVEPLRDCLPDLRAHVLDRCGHTPWNERHAREDFFELLFKKVRVPGAEP